MFWRFGFHTQSAVDALLDRDQFELEELLDEEELLQECKAHNKKLLDFLCKAGVLEALLAYITEDPAPDLPEESKYKYPTIACEVLCSDILAVYDSLFLNEELLEAFWKFLDKPAPLNPLQGSFFIRVFSILLLRKIPQTLAFIKKQPNPVDSMLAHIGLSAMMDLIMKITSCEEVKEGEGIVQWLADNQLVEKLALKIDGDSTSEDNSNASQLLIDILNTSHAFGASKNIMLERIKSKATVETIVKGMLKPESPNFTAAMYHGLAVFIELVQKYVVSTQVQDGTPAVDVSDMVAVVVPHLPQMFAIMEKPYVAPGELANTTFPQSKPLGLLRLRIIEFFSALLHTNNQAVYDAFVKLQVLPYFVNLFFAYPQHNFLHTLVQDMVIKTLTSDQKIAGPLVASLLKDARLTDLIAEAAVQNEGEIVQERGSHRGYMGHITLIAADLVKYAEAEGLDADVKAVFDRDAWKEYVNKSLKETRDRDSKPLGGHRPVAPTEPEGGMDNFSNSNDDLSNQDPFARFMSHQAAAHIPQKLADDDDDDDDDVNGMDQDFAKGVHMFNPFDKHRSQEPDEEDKYFYSGGLDEQQKSFANFANFDQ